MDELTFRPDAHTETTSCDGHIIYPATPTISWQELLDKTSAAPYDEDTTSSVSIKNDVYNPGYWVWISRGYVMFDTSELVDNDVITSAYLELYGSSKADIGSIAPNINIYTVTTSGETELINTDFNKANFGVAICNTPITYSGWSITGWNRFVLNSDGLNAISRTGVTKIGIRNANYDVAEVEPSWADTILSSLRWYNADQGVDYAPRLVVNYLDAYPSTTKDRVTGVTYYINPEKDIFLSELTIGGLDVRWQPTESEEKAEEITTQEKGNWIFLGLRSELTAEGFIFYYLWQDPEGNLVKKATSDNRGTPPGHITPPSGRGLGPLIDLPPF